MISWRIEGDWPWKHNPGTLVHGDTIMKLCAVQTDVKSTHLSMPGIVQDDGGVGVVAQKDGHEGGDELMTQGVPGGADL